MVDYKNILTGVAERLSCLREERPSAGTRYRLRNHGVGSRVDQVTVLATASDFVDYSDLWRSL